MTDDERKKIREELASMGLPDALVESLIGRQEEMEECFHRALGKDFKKAK